MRRILLYELGKFNWTAWLEENSSFRANGHYPRPAISNLMGVLKKNDLPNTWEDNYEVILLPTMPDLVLELTAEASGKASDLSGTDLSKISVRDGLTVEIEGIGSLVPNVSPESTLEDAVEVTYVSLRNDHFNPADWNIELLEMDEANTFIKVRLTKKE